MPKSIGLKSVSCLILVLASGCTQLSSSSRVASSRGSGHGENAEDSEAIAATSGDGTTEHPTDSNANPPGFAQGAVPIAINGFNLYAAQVWSRCMTPAPCTEVVMSAGFKGRNADGVEKVFRLEGNNLKKLKIRTYLWLGLPANCVRADTTHPQCSRRKKGAEKRSIEVTFTNNAVLMADDPDEPLDYDGSESFGNFVHSESGNCAPTGLTGYGETEPKDGRQIFSSAWVVEKDEGDTSDSLKNVLCVTNPLYLNPNGLGDTISGSSAYMLCPIGFRLPSISEWCGSAENSSEASPQSCSGGLIERGISGMPGLLTQGYWASTASQNYGVSSLWTVDPMKGQMSLQVLSAENISILCVK